MWKIYGISLILLIGHIDVIQSQLSRNEITDSVYDVNVNRDRGWMDTAKEALAGPTGQMVVHLAREMLNRSTGNSQILSLNLTNLLILVFLKAIIFAAGLIGAGNWNNQIARARSIDSTLLIQPDEPELFIGYLAAVGSGDETCLHRAACLSPGKTTDYLKAGKAILKTAEMFNAEFANDMHYRELIQRTERAVLDGMQGAPCEIIYHCRL